MEVSAAAGVGSLGSGRQPDRGQGLQCPFEAGRFWGRHYFQYSAWRPGTGRCGKSSLEKATAGLGAQGLPEPQQQGHMAIANSGAVPFDDDLDGNLDIDPDEISEVEMARQKIKQLMHEQERAADYEDRLTRKLQRLDADLASKREQVEGLQRTLNLERNKFAEDGAQRGSTREYRSEKRERETKAKTQEERIREYLTEVLYTKPKQKEKRGEFHLDTVLVSFVKPNESFRYNLAFRVDSGTTIAQLRNSACKYWGVSSEHFILRTMANNKCQDDNKVKERPGSPGQSGLFQARGDRAAAAGDEARERRAAFRGGAEGNSAEEQEADTLLKKALAGNRSKGKPRYNAEGVEQIQKFGENYANQMGGVFFLLKLRDSKPSEHAGKINLRNILIYTALVILSGYVYMVRRPVGEAYWCAKGIQDYLLVSTPRAGGATGTCTGASALDRQLCVPGFEEPNSEEKLGKLMDFLGKRRESEENCWTSPGKMMDQRS
eukprot:s1096_g34.t1